MRKELILKPVNSGGCQTFIIPKRQLELDFVKQYRVIVEEVE